MMRFMKRAALLHPARRLALVTLIALLVVAIASRINPKMKTGSPEPDVESCLTKRAAEVSIDTRSLADAINSLQTAFKTEIRVDTPNRWTDGKGIIMRRKNVSLGQALAMVLRLFDESGDKLTYHVKDDVIRIAAENPNAAELVTRIYDITAWLEGDKPAPEWHEAFTNGYWEEPPEILENFVMEVVRTWLWDRNGGTSGACLKIRGHFLIVRAPVTAQREIRRLVFEMNSPAIEQAGRIKAVPK